MKNALILALTIFGEARGEKVEGQIAVGCVIRNRVFRTGKSYAEVCQQKDQFTCWNPDDPNYKLLMNPETLSDNRYFKQCEWLARGIINGSILSNVSVSENYLTTTLYDTIKATKPMHWANKLKRLDEIGNHTFLV